jgi:hypothetical protein
MKPRHLPFASEYGTWAAPSVVCSATVVTAVGLCLAPGEPAAALAGFAGFAALCVSLTGAPARTWLLSGLSVGAVTSGPCLLAFWAASPLLAVLSSLLLSIFFGVAFVTAALLRGMLPVSWACCALPGGWLAAAYVVDEWIFAYPPLGAALINTWTYGATVVQLVGVPALDGLMLVVASSLGFAVASPTGKRRPHVTRAAATAGLWLGLLALSKVVRPEHDAPAAPITAIQPAITATEYREAVWNLGARKVVRERIYWLSEQGLSESGSLVVWPEGATALPELQLRDGQGRLGRLLEGSPASEILVSVPLVSGEAEQSAVVLLDRSGPRGIARKNRLGASSRGTGPNSSLCRATTRRSVAVSYWTGMPRALGSEPSRLVGP